MIMNYKYEKNLFINIFKYRNWSKDFTLLWIIRVAFFQISFFLFWVFIDSLMLLSNTPFFKYNFQILNHCCFSCYNFGIGFNLTVENVFINLILFYWFSVSFCASFHMKEFFFYWTNSWSIDMKWMIFTCMNFCYYNFL